MQRVRDPALGHDLQPLIARIVGERAFLDDGGAPEMPGDAHVLPAFPALAIDDDKLTATVLPGNAPIAFGDKELN